MKIVHIVRGDFNPNALNGVYKVIDSLSNAMVCGEGVDVVVCSVGKLTPYIFNPESYDHVRVGESKFLFSITRSFKDFIKQQDLDTIFHFHSVFIPWFLRAVKYLHGNGFNRIVLTPHGQYTSIPMGRSLKKRTFFQLFDAKVIRLVSVVHLIGHAEENCYITQNAKKYELIPNGCDHIEEQGVVSGRKLIFGYLGRLDIEQKGLDTLIDSFIKYKDEGGKGELRIAGNGSDKPKLEALVNASVYRHSIFFDGVVFDDMKWAFLSRCAFFCHPSRWDGLPTSALEAAACSVPLIVTTDTNIGIYVRNYKAGMVLNDDDRDLSLKDAFKNMEALFEDKCKYEEMCTCSRKIIERELNWVVIARRVFNQLYKNI